jgi:methionyl-tRNA synthetase
MNDTNNLNKTTEPNTDLKPVEKTNAKPEATTDVGVNLVTNAKISYDDFAKVEMKVGKILKAEPIPKSDKLLKLSVDFAEGITPENPMGTPRQILSGIAKYFPDPNLLVGKKCMFVTNLAPRQMMGQESNGMILAVSTDDGEFSLLEPKSVKGGDIPAGTKAR